MSMASSSSSYHSAENGNPVHHAIDIDASFISEFEETLQELPRLLNVSAGRDSCCIFRAPPSLTEINEKAYQPLIVSIGPFHHGKPQYQMIQEHKKRFLKDLLLRMESQGIVLKHFFRAVAPMEEKIRKSYSETLKFNGRDLIWMMVLDGCFIVELFHKVWKKAQSDRSDPLFAMAWVLPSLTRDLLRLENQIPYFVLQELFDLSGGSGNNGPSLAELALGFFNYMVPREETVLKKYYDKEGKHLLDLFRMSYISNCQEKLAMESKFLHPIQCAKKLDQAGVKFRPRPKETDSILDIIFKFRPRPKESHSILDIKFRNGLLEIPILTVDDFWSSMFLNFVAYEQCYCHSPKHITTYCIFMGYLINTPADAGFLGDRKIIKNNFGTDEEVARFFSNVGKEVVSDIKRSYLPSVIEDVNKYCQNGWHVQRAGFMHTYFSTPWSFISLVAAVALLLLTIIQAYYTVYQYHKPPPK